jgi:hypothetical protein
MSIKTFLVGRMNRVFARDDLAPRDDAAHTLGDAAAALEDPLLTRSSRERPAPSTWARTARSSPRSARSSRASSRATCACTSRSPSTTASC